ncbi:MAG: B12-binding domain-containing protein [Candidatus Bathyarchaeia archaeon]
MRPGTKGKGQILEELRDRLVDLDIEAVKAACDEALEAGVPPLEAVTRGLAKGMEVVGERFEKREYFLPELIMAGEVMKEGLSILEPHLVGSEMGAGPRVVIGTVQGDMHDIGKGVVASLLRASGFMVHDLGFDVPAAKFVEAVKEDGAQILAMSALLTATMPEMKRVVGRLEEDGVRDGVKVIIGGAPITKAFGESIGVDHATNDAVEGVNMCKKWAVG